MHGQSRLGQLHLFQLQGGSICIDQGTNNAEYLPATDLDGNDRVIGSKVDMGVYER